jgi:hypothetical protein
MPDPQTSFLEKLFPRQANNDYRGSPIALYAFCVLLVPFTFRAFVHFLKNDGGVHSIATILVFPGDPDPNVVIHMFSSLWGGQQLIMLLFYYLVIARYRNLLPLLWVILILETAFRATSGSLHPMTDAHYLEAPPGSYVNLPMAILAPIMLYLSMRTRGEKAPTSEGEASRA